MALNSCFSSPTWTSMTTQSGGIGSPAVCDTIGAAVYARRPVRPVRGNLPDACEKLRNFRWFSVCVGCTVEGEGEAPDLLLENV